MPTYYIVAPAEASSNLARYDGVRYAYRAPLDGRDATLDRMYDRTRRNGFGDEVKRRIMLGTYALSAGYYDAYYLKAQQVRTLIRDDYDAAFRRVDAVAMPTTPTTAFRIGERSDDPLQLYVGDVFTAQRQPHRAARHQPSVRAGRRRAPGRLAAHRTRFRRRDADQGRRRL